MISPQIIINYYITVDATWAPDVFTGEFWQLSYRNTINRFLISTALLCLKCHQLSFWCFSYQLHWSVSRWRFGRPSPLMISCSVIIGFKVYLTLFSFQFWSQCLSWSVEDVNYWELIAVTSATITFISQFYSDKVNIIFGAVEQIFCYHN